jgi:hypothetical protein
MHYTTEDLYFRLKEGTITADVTAHLAGCDQCRHALQQAELISDLFLNSIQEPPPLRVSQKETARVQHTFPGFFRPVFAASFCLLAVVSVSLFTARIANDHSSKKNIPSFVYETYNNIYDFDYYKTNYIDKTDVLQNGGLNYEKP